MDGVALGEAEVVLEPQPPELVLLLPPLSFGQFTILLRAATPATASFGYTLVSIVVIRCQLSCPRVPVDNRGYTPCPAAHLSWVAGAGHACRPNNW